jgi:hypothetical protein
MIQNRLHTILVNDISKKKEKAEGSEREAKEKFWNWK